MLTTAQKAKWIIQILCKNELNAIQEAVRLRVELAGQEAMRAAWERERDELDWRETNRYNTDNLKEKVKLAETHVSDCRETLKFANDHFLDMIKEEE